MSWLTSRALVKAQFAFISTPDGLNGWIRKDLPKDLVAELITDPERLLADPKSETLKTAPKGKVVKRTVTGGNGALWNIVLKESRHSSLWRRLGCLFLPSPAFQSLVGSVLLSHEQVDTAKALAAFERRRWSELGKSYYFSEEVKDSESIDSFWAYKIAPRPRRENLRERAQVLRAIAALFYRLHSHGIFHRDLKGANILLRKQGVDRWQCLLIDVTGISKSPQLNWPRRIKNLEQLVRTFGFHLTDRELTYLIKRYADLFTLPRDRRRTLVGSLRAILPPYGERQPGPDQRSSE